MAKSLSSYFDSNGGETPITLHKPKDTTLVTIKDTRKTNPISGKPLGSKNNKTLKVNQEVLTGIISEAKAAGIDPYTALSIAYQENNFESKDKLFNLNPNIFGKPFGNAQEGMKSLLDQFKFAKNLQGRKVIPDSEEYLLQGNNGYGKIKKGHADLEGSTSIYGVPIPEEGIDFKKNPYYGKTVLSLRDEILKNNELVKGLVDSTPASNTKYSLGGQTMKRLTGKERLAKYATGGELGPTPPPTPYVPDAFQPFSQEYAMAPGKAPKAAPKMIKLKDTRTVNPATGKAYSKDKMGGKSINVDPSVLSTIVSHAKAQGVDPYDALAIAYQETGFGNSGTGLGESKDYYPDQEVSDSFNEIDERYMNEQANQLVKGLKDKFKYSKSLGYSKKGKAYDYQAYNGYGKLKANKGQATSYYGIPVTPDNPLDMSVNPAYGKTVMSLRELLANNQDVKNIIDTSKPFKAYANFATGGQATDVEGMPDLSSAVSGGGGAGWGSAGQLLPVVGNAIMSLLDKPSYNNQPIVNAQTAKNMTSPYAFGGELDDIDAEQFREYLEAMFANQQSAEEEEDDTLVEGVDEENPDEEDDAEDSFAMGGKVGKKKIHIKPSKKGTFTAAANKHNKSVQTFASQVLSNKGKYSPAMVKKANFARNAAKWHGMGGDTYGAMGYYAQGGDTQIEVEGDEIIQTPDGQMQKMDGPSHEQGGIDMNVPKGTKIYSDRLELEGKTMQQRKMNREKRLAKAQATLGTSPSDAIARNTFERTKQVVEREEQQDMALQKMANKIYAPPQQGGRKAAYGDEVGDPWSDYISTHVMGLNPNVQVPYTPDVVNNKYLDNGMQGLPLSSSNTGISNNSPANVNIPVVGQTGVGFTPSPAQMASAQTANAGGAQYSSPAGLTTGDYIGLGSNLFNAIAPIINTKRAARATKPEINRFQSFGRDALEANAKAQGFAGIQMSNAKRELDTASGSATLRNRLGARGINTARALDTVTDINRNKGISDIYGGYTTQMSNLLGQQAQLSNQRDQVVMSGATARDQREAQNTDNYYSNMAENLTNFGTNIGNIGKSLNQSQGNKDNSALLSQLSEYFDFGRDKSGKLVLKNKGK